MKKFAVGYISFFHNELIVDIVNAESELLAVLEHKEIKRQESSEKEFIDWIKEFDDFEKLKEEFFNGDMAIDVKEIA